MGRAKIKMEYITKEKTRNTTYEKRKHGLIKKAAEFNTLIDVDTAVIIYPPNSNKPAIWPENPDDIKKSIASYKSKDENGKRNYGVKEYFEERKKKIDDQLVKARKRSMEARYATWFDELDGLSEGQLRHFAMGLENKENTVRDYLEFQKRMKFEPVNFQYGGPQLGLEQVQVVNHHLMNNGLGWFDGAPTTSFVPLKSEVGGYGYPMFEGGMVYGNPNPNPWLFQPPVMQCAPMPEFAMQELDPQVNSGVGDFVMDDYRGRFLG
ncbi:hypothetical protein L2E82_22293 [Cichorium intybus]|uniref:Uncharacterized protein n=1 Tax=Cichorium intybus TaxID=13427 RepID=A0ACB9DXG2_CICIN|nr:hypothetical protein L2E82_22293 [Cichorium intybus]